jgi:hypothetical protein
VLHKGRYCPKCFEEKQGMRVNMKLDERDTADGLAWRCSTCTKRMSLRKETVFENFRLSFKCLISIIIHWAIQSRQCDIAEIAECSRSGVISFEQHLRKVAGRASNVSSTVLGGRGRIVEIDESMYIKVNITK